MITDFERKKIKELLPQYVKSVQEVMREKAIFNKQGKVYGKQMIMNVFAGRSHNPRIEMAIFLAYEKAKKELNNARERAINVMTKNN